MTNNTQTSNETRRSFLSKLATFTAVFTVAHVLPTGVANAASAATTSKAWPTGMALDITFSVATKVSGRVKRPYVAVWIEDASGKTVRNLTVWIRQGQANPRWLSELRRWTRDNSALASTISSATRNPGTYAIAWDGKNDKGVAMPQGDYYLCVEAAREHGPYSLVREKVTVGSATYKKTLAANNDVESVSVSFNKA